MAKPIDRRGSIAGADHDTPEGGLKRLKKLYAQLRSSFYGKAGIIRDVQETVELGDLTVKEVPHEEILREADSAKLLKRTIATGLSHR
jgi:hypothetical protein